MIELSCLHGSERYAACFDEVVARTVRVSQPAVLSASLVIQLFGIVIPPPIFPYCIIPPYFQTVSICFT